MFNKLTHLLTNNFKIKILLSVILALIMINYSGFAQDTVKTYKFDKYRLSIYAGMGLEYTATPSYNNYTRAQIFGGAHDSVSSISPGLEVFGGLEYELSKTFSLRLDYSYFFKSKTYYNPLAYDYFYFIHQPYLVGSYILAGNGYKIKIGAGIGYHFGQFQTGLTGQSSINYNSSGLAIKGEGVFSVKISRKMETYISGFVFGQFMSSLKDSNGTVLKNNLTGSDVNLSGYGIGVRLGFLVNIL